MYGELFLPCLVGGCPSEFSLTEVTEEKKASATTSDHHEA